MAKRGRKPGRPALSGISLASLQAEIQRRTTKAGGLLKKRERLLGQLDAVETKIRSAGLDTGGAPAAGGRRGAAGSARRGGGRRRARNEMNLVEALAKVLDGKTMSVTDAADAVQKAGYKTTSKTFRTIVNQTLIKSNRFKKIDRGQYTAKK
jgi:hypothetical protein